MFPKSKNRNRGDQHGAADLEEELLPRIEAVAAILTRGGGELEPVVDATENAKPQEDEQGLLDERVAEFGPQQRGQCGREQDDQPAHGGGVGLLLRQFVECGVVEFGPVPDLHPHEPANDPRADQQRNRQRRQDRHDRAKHDVLVRVEVQRLGEEVAKMEKQMIDHLPCKDRRSKRKTRKAVAAMRCPPPCCSIPYL